MIASAVGFGDEGAKLALTAFELTIFESFKRIFYTLGHGLGVGSCFGIF